MDSNTYNTYVYIYTYIYIYIYIYIITSNGVSTNCVTAISLFFDGWTFCVLPLTYFCLPKRARAYLFPQAVKIHYFCSGPMSVDPICPQPTPVCMYASARYLSVVGWILASLR